jgi:hypothetical protein
MCYAFQYLALLKYLQSAGSGIAFIKFYFPLLCQFSGTVCELDNRSWCVPQAPGMCDPGLRYIIQYVAPPRPPGSWYQATVNINKITVASGEPPTELLTWTGLHPSLHKIGTLMVDVAAHGACKANDGIAWYSRFGLGFDRPIAIRIKRPSSRNHSRCPENDCKNVRKWY